MTTITTEIQKPPVDKEGVVTQLLDVIAEGLDVDTHLVPDILLEDTKERIQMVLNTWIDDHICHLLEGMLGDELETLFGETLEEAVLDQI